MIALYGHGERKAAAWRITIYLGAASLVLLQLLTEESRPTGGARRSAGLRRKRNERRHQFAAKVLKRDRASGTRPAAAATEAGEAEGGASAEASAE